MRLLTRFVNDLTINLALSINFILCKIFIISSLPSLSTFQLSFFIRTEKVWYFLRFPHDIQIIPQTPLLNVIILSVLKNYSNLCDALLYLPVK